MTPEPERWLDEAPGAFFVTTMDGQITWANRTLAAWLGDDVAPAGRSIHELLTPGGSLRFESVMPSLKLNKRLGEVGLAFGRQDGGTLHLWCSAVAGAVSGGENEVLWFGLDVTDRQINERDLLVVERRLRRVQKLSAGFAAATTAEDVANTFLDQLVDGVKADDGAVCVVDGRGALVQVAERLSDRPLDVRDADDEHVTRALAEGVPVFASMPAELHPSMLGPPRHVAALPLQGDAGTLGVIRLGLHRTVPHSTDEQHLLRSAAEMCAQSLERVQLLARLRSEAMRNGAMSALLHHVEEATTLVERAQLIADFVVPDAVDYASVEIVAHGPEPAGLRHRDPALEPTLRWLRSRVSISVDDENSLARVRETRRPRVLNDIGEELYDHPELDEEERGALRSLAPTAYLGLPLISRNKVIGSMLLAQSESRRRFSDDDVAFFARLADACALALENAQLYEHERGVAEQLQTALLPTRLPRDPRVRVASFYEAGQELERVGGDWYDSFMIGDDRIGFAVGDVVGGGITAAITMAQLRTALWAYALDGRGVADCLGRLDRLAASVPGSLASSVVYAELDLVSNELTFACAGHPPPVLVEPGAAPTLLWEGRSSLLGVISSTIVEGRASLVPGSSVVFYTDGLVERRGRSLDDGFARLSDLLADEPELVVHPELIAGRLGTHEHGDDTCVLTVTVAPVRTESDSGSGPGSGGQRKFSK